MKLGLANLAIVITLYFFGPGNAAAVQLVRIVVVGFLFGNLFSIAFSLAGGFFSLAVMCLAKRYGGFTVYESAWPEASLTISDRSALRLFWWKM